MLAAVGCGRTPAAAGAPIPASAIGWLTAMAHRAATMRYDTKLWMRDLMEGAAYLPK
jgi:hypothetical protein